MTDSHASERREYTFAHTDSRSALLRALGDKKQASERFVDHLRARLALHEDAGNAAGVSRLDAQIEEEIDYQTRLLMRRDIIMRGWEEDDARGFRY
jgi:hypothetical protein